MEIFLVGFAIGVCMFQTAKYVAEGDAVFAVIFFAATAGLIFHSFT